MDSDGNRVDLLANDTGRVDITQAVRIEGSGKYLINVEADGDWSIDITQD